LLSSPPRDPATGRPGTAQSCAGDVRTRHQEAFLYREGVRPWDRRGRCPRPVGVPEASGQCPHQRAGTSG